jgi:hypothetical protein
MENENQQPERTPSPEEIVLVEARSTLEVLTAGLTKLIHDQGQMGDLVASQQATLAEVFKGMNELNDRINVQTRLYDDLNQRVARLEPHGRPN